MAGDNGTAPHLVTLSQALEEGPYNFGFFNALRQLECAYSNKPKFGKSLRPADDPIRMGQEPSLAFANATLAAFEPAKDGRYPRLVQRFFGLLGPHGPLPLHLTEYVLDRIHNHGDITLVRFLDMFHHRMLMLFYRAWANAQPTVSFDRPHTDQFRGYVGALIGIGMPTLLRRDPMPDVAKLYYSGLLACQTKHAEGLTAIITEFLDIPSKIEQFVGHWLELAVDDRWQLGISHRTGKLGMNVIVGSKAWDCQHKFRIVLGPMNYSDYQRLLPGSHRLTTLIAVVRNYTGDEFNWDIRLMLHEDQVPVFELGKTGNLGWTTWLYSEAAHMEADAFLLDPFKVSKGVKRTECQSKSIR
jgi:type VI secretion system protein ImpH